MKRDPIPNFRKYLIDNGVADEDELCGIEAGVAKEVSDAIEFAAAQPWPDADSVVVDVYSDIVEEARKR